MQKATSNTAIHSPEDYIQNRFDTQLRWYEQKSANNKQWHYFCQSLVIVCGALIPLLVGYSNPPYEYLKYVAGALGVVVAVTEGIMGLRKYKENWLVYRGTAQALQREKTMYIHQIGDYADSENNFQVFVLKAEQIMASENTNWVALLSKKSDKN